MELEYKRCSIFYILLLFLCNVICLAAENDPEIFNIQNNRYVSKSYPMIGEGCN